MSIFDMVKQAAQGVEGGESHAAVAGGLLQELGGSGGVGSLIQNLQQSGAGNLVQQWASGNTQAMDPNTIEQTLGNMGLVDSIAQRTGMSADTVRSGLATIVPVLVHHLTSNGHLTTDGQTTGNPAPETGSLIQSVLGRIL
ncbi:MAG: YidB family protein [Acidobacteriota bacterium]